MAFTDWREVLRPASFRNVPFFVRSDTRSHQNDIVEHKIANSDTNYLDRMGGNNEREEVTAYLASDNVIAESEALFGACKDDSAATLVLPVEGARQMSCLSISRAHDRDIQGYIAFDLSFIQDGLATPLGAIAVLERAVSVLAESAPAIVRGAFLRNFSTLGQVQWVLDNARYAMQGFASEFDAVRNEIRMTSSAGSTAARSVVRLFDDAYELAYDGKEFAHVSQTFLGQSVRNGAGGAFVDRAHEMMTVLREGATTPDDAFEAFETMAEFGLSDARSLVVGLSSAQDDANHQAITAAVRRMAVVNLAMLAAEIDHEDRRSAMNMRATVSELMQREISMARGDHEVVGYLQSLRGKASDAIRQKMASITGVVEVETSQSASARVHAYRLYGDARRAGEIVARNRLRGPSMVPRIFEALAE